MVSRLPASSDATRELLQLTDQSPLHLPNRTESKDGICVPSSKQCPLHGLSNGHLGKVQRGPLVVFPRQTRGVGSSVGRTSSGACKSPT